MGRVVSLPLMVTATVTAVVIAGVGVAGCGGSDDEPGQITRIDGPASVDEEILNGGDGSSDG